MGIWEISANVNRFFGLFTTHFFTNSSLGQVLFEGTPIGKKGVKKKISHDFLTRKEISVVEIPTPLMTREVSIFKVAVWSSFELIRKKKLQKYL